jgi:hypothetical protein
MRKFEVELDDKMTRVLMRFLVQQDDTDHLNTLLKRVHDKSDREVKHDECAVIANVLIDHASLQELFITAPMTSTTRFYLKLHPESSEKVRRFINFFN